MHRSSKIRPALRSRSDYERIASIQDGSRQIATHTAVAQAQLVERELLSIREDLSGAAQLQHLLNGPRELRRGHYEIACEMFPVRQISGDFCTVFDVGSRTVFALGDIAGKGLAAGMWFTHIMSLVRFHAQMTPDPAGAVTGINRELCSLRLDRPLITVYLGSLDWKTDTLTYCRAGHPPPVVVRAGGGSELSHEGGPVLGVLPRAEYETGKMRFGPGDGLLAYTDGLSELHNEHGEEFGISGLLDEAERSERHSAAGFLFSMLGAVKDFAGIAQPNDDLTMLAVLRNEDR